MDAFADGADDDSLEAFVRSLEHASVVRDRHFDVVVANQAAADLSPGLRVGQNLLRSVFLSDEPGAVCRFDDAVPGNAVALLRDSLEQHEEDGRFAALIGELSTRSATFSALWAGSAVVAAHHGVLASGSRRELRFAELRPVGEYEYTAVVISEARRALG